MTAPRTLAAALSLLALAACGGEEPAKQEPAPNPIQQRTAPTRRAADDAEKAMAESQARMEAQAREAAGEPADTAR